MIAFMLVSGLVGTSEFSSCSESFRPSFEVSLNVQPLSVTSERTATELNALAKQFHATLMHPALGFYSSTFGYTLAVEKLPANKPGCAANFKIKISLGLVNRQIGIARDLTSGSCLYSTYLLHYMRHAARDASIIAIYRARIIHALQIQELHLTGGPTTLEQQAKLELRTLVDTTLAPLTADRATAVKEVDNTREIDKLKKACSGNGAEFPLQPF